MSATLTIIKLGTKCMISYIGTETELAEALTGCALRDEVIAKAVAITAEEVDKQQQTSRELIYMTKK